MTAERFMEYTLGPLKEAAVDIPASKASKLRALARQYDGQRFEAGVVAREVSDIFSDDPEYNRQVEKTIERNFRKGPFY